MADVGFGCIWGDCVKQPKHLITDLSNGATVSLCDDDYAPGLIPLLAAELGVDPTHFYAHIEKYIKAQNVKAEKELAGAQAAAAVKGSKVPATSPDGDLTCGYCGNPLDDGESHLHAGQEQETA